MGEEEYSSLSSSLCSFLLSPVTSSLLRPNILLNTLVSNTHSLHSFKSERPSFTPIAYPYCTVDTSTNSQQLQRHIVQLTPVLTVSNCSDIWYSWHQY
jgi:hypothetical protein